MKRTRAKRLAWAALELAIIARGRWKARDLGARGHAHTFPFCLVCEGVRSHELVAQGAQLRGEQLARAEACERAPVPPADAVAGVRTNAPGGMS